MAEDIPLFPNETNNRTLKDFINLQKELKDHLLDERKLYEQIGRVSLDIQNRVIQRREHEFRLMGDVRNMMGKINELSERLVGTTGATRTHLNMQIESVQDQIKYKKELLEMSREGSKFEIERANQMYEESVRYFKFASEQGKELFGIQSSQVSMAKNLGDKLVGLGVVGEAAAYSIGGILMMLSGAYNTFLKLDTAAWNFRKAMGMSRPEAAAIRNSAEKMYIDFMDVGVTIEGAYNSFKALGKVVGGVHNVSQDLVENVALMSAQLGISEESSAKFLRNLAAISKNSMESQQSMMGFSQAMSSAAGVPLQDVMNDVASKVPQTLTMMSRLPNIVVKTAIELRRMGTSLDQAARSSRHMLDFTENVNEEMNASVLLGRSINLQRARELSYRRDLEGSQKEILRITKSINFEKLDVFQQEAYAAATGKTVDELLNMLQTDKQIERTRISGTPEAKKQLKIYEEMHKMNVANAKALGQNTEAIFRSKANQERLAAITAKWNQLLIKAQSFLFPIIDLLLRGVLVLTEWAPQIMMFSVGFGKLFTWLSKIDFIVDKIGFALLNFDKAGKSFTVFQKIAVFFATKAPAMTKFFTTIISWISKAFGYLGGFFKIFGKFLGPIGFIITAFQLISGFLKGWNSTSGNILQKLGGGLMGALRNVIPFFDKIVQFIKWIWGGVMSVCDAIAEWFNPIQWVINAFKLAWTVVKLFWNAGVSGVKLWWGWIKKVWGIAWEIGKFMFKWFTPIGLIITGIKGLLGYLDKLKSKVGAVWSGVKHFFGGGPSVEAKVKAQYVPAAKITPRETRIKAMNPYYMSSHSKKDGATPMSDEIGKKMVDLLEKIHNKNTTVNLDGNKVSTYLARSNEHSGGWGSNKT